MILGKRIPGLSSETVQVDRLPLKMGSRILPRTIWVTLSEICCGTSISPRYPMVELLAAVLCVAIAELWVVRAAPGTLLLHATIETLLYFVFAGGLLIATFVDLDLMRRRIQADHEIVMRKIGSDGRRRQQQGKREYEHGRTITRVKEAPLLEAHLCDDGDVVAERAALVVDEAIGGAGEAERFEGLPGAGAIEHAVDVVQERPMNPVGRVLKPEVAQHPFEGLGSRESVLLRVVPERVERLPRFAGPGGAHVEVSEHDDGMFRRRIGAHEFRQLRSLLPARALSPG